MRSRYSGLSLWGLRLLIVLLSAVTSSCGPRIELKGLVAGETVRAVEATDGNLLVLEDGRVVRLAEIEAPSGQSGSGESANIARLARARLQELAIGKPLLLAFGGRQSLDEVILAHVFDVSNRNRPIWLQAQMVQGGWSRVHSWSDNRARATKLLAAEEMARQARLGLWAQPEFAIWSTTDLATAENPRRGFALVEGTLRDVANRDPRVYLNFGADWRTDFTASVDVKALNLWPHGADDLSALVGKRIRVRGVLRERNGPMIDVDHPEQIEIIL